jgi:hypothetical protein
MAVEAFMAERGAEYPLGHEQRVEGDGGRSLSAVDEGEAFLGAKFERWHAEPFERILGGKDVAGDIDAALAQQYGDEVGERG